MIRFGIVAMTAFLLTEFLGGSVMTVQPAVWYAGPSVLNLMFIATLALYGYFRLSRHFPRGRRASRDVKSPESDGWCHAAPFRFSSSSIRNSRGLHSEAEPLLGLRGVWSPAGRV